MKEEALKLADELASYYDSDYDKAEAMIRRLVEELDRNKIYIQKMEDALGCDVSYYEPLNKPVNPFAWVDDCFSFFTDDDYSMLDDELKEGMIPLYTHPQTKPTITKLDGKVAAVTMTDDEHRVHEVLWEAQKPLSDDEIMNTFENCLFDGGFNAIDFARAIEERHGIK